MLTPHIDDIGAFYETSLARDQVLDIMQRQKS